MTEVDGVLLNVAAVRPVSTVNGPGRRAVLWVQGCTVGCPGCFNPQTHPHESRRLVDPIDLGLRLLGGTDLDGLTISGGEPFEQAAACARLAEAVRGIGKSVMVFSGYTHDVLCRSEAPAVLQFLRSIDLLVAGPYVANQSVVPRDWIASRNQRLQSLTPRGQVLLAEHDRATEVVEVSFGADRIEWSGFPHTTDLEWLTSLAPDRRDVRCDRT